ncbi:C-X-C motif chemokine 16 [Fukomys damarensis]|uniref:C-X-C motif chemokine 16 n=1 Tax=Fukomys damarensis TaxID=885580 RepID=A0A091DJD8_FUKDA|nr:C-X-C motif chemokine 16 [Fukomys damarensis]KFO22916.1 C-X-C motif chemokine 16 [Fukomys damarensis]
MRRGWGPRPRALLLLLTLVAQPGDGNRSSAAGGCHCSRRIPSSSSPQVEFTKHLQKYTKAYSHCGVYIRFQLPSRSVCGDSRDQWVLTLMSCLDLRECGHAYWENLAHQKHLSSPGMLISRPTEGVPQDRSTHTQKYPPSALPFTEKPTLLPGTQSLEKEPTLLKEITTSLVGCNLGAGHEAKENQKQLEGKAGATSGTSAVVPVLSLLVIVFFLIGVILYMQCKRKRGQPAQYSPGVMACV